jgi:hypothetical protein
MASTSIGLNNIEVGFDVFMTQQAIYGNTQ